MFENNSNIITLKLKYSTDENSKTRILEYIKNYNNVLRFTYNRLHENKDLKTKEIKKNIVQGNFDEDKVVYAQSLEELSINETFSSFKELYDKVKKSKTRYRFPLENCSYAVFRKKHIKTYQTLYKFV